MKQLWHGYANSNCLFVDLLIHILKEIFIQLITIPNLEYQCYEIQGISGHLTPGNDLKIGLYVGSVISY